MTPVPLRPAPAVPLVPISPPSTSPPSTEQQIIALAREILGPACVASTSARQLVKFTRQARELLDWEKVQIRDERFEQFWERYPCKKAKRNAHRAWMRAKVDAALFTKIMGALEWQKSDADSDLRKDDPYVPHAANWLDGQRWEDEMGEKLAKVFGSVKPAARECWRDDETL